MFNLSFPCLSWLNFYNFIVSLGLVIFPHFSYFRYIPIPEPVEMSVYASWYKKTYPDQVLSSCLSNCRPTFQRILQRGSDYCTCHYSNGKSSCSSFFFNKCDFLWAAVHVLKSKFQNIQPRPFLYINIIFLYL